MRSANSFYKFTIERGLYSGVTIIIIAIYTSFMLYDSQGIPYSILNHFMSELGHSQQPGATFFRVAFVVIGLLLPSFFWFIQQKVLLKATKMAFYISVLSGFASMLVGFFPADKHLEPHLIGVFILLISTLIAINLVLFAYYQSQKLKLSGGQIVLSIWTGISGLSLLIVPKESVRLFFKDRVSFHRPDLWLIPILEWITFISVVCWILYMLYRDQEEERTRAQRQTD